MGDGSEVKFCTDATCFAVADAAATASFHDADNAFYRLTTVIDARLVVALHLAPVEAAATGDDANHPTLITGTVNLLAVVAFVRDKLLHQGVHRLRTRSTSRTSCAGRTRANEARMRLVRVLTSAVHFTGTAGVFPSIRRV